METKMLSSHVEIPQKKIADFCKRYKVSRLALFGSVLREDFRSDSDVDILVAFNPSARVTFMTLGRMKRELSEIFNRHVDLVPEEGLKPSIRREVLASAQEVYAS
jgi:predicted nucleotidyltransferase